MKPSSEAMWQKCFWIMMNVGYFHLQLPPRDSAICSPKVVGVFHERKKYKNTIASAFQLRWQRWMYRHLRVCSFRRTLSLSGISGYWITTDVPSVSQGRGFSWKSRPRFEMSIFGNCALSNKWFPAYRQRGRRAITITESEISHLYMNYLFIYAPRTYIAMGFFKNITALPNLCFDFQNLFCTIFRKIFFMKLFSLIDPSMRTSFK